MRVFDALTTLCWLFCTYYAVIAVNIIQLVSTSKSALSLVAEPGGSVKFELFHEGTPLNERTFLSVDIWHTDNERRIELFSELNQGDLIVREANGYTITGRMLNGYINIVFTIDVFQRSDEGDYRMAVTVTTIEPEIFMDERIFDFTIKASHRETWDKLKRSRMVTHQMVMPSLKSVTESTLNVVAGNMEARVPAQGVVNVIPGYVYPALVLLLCSLVLLFVLLLLVIFKIILKRKRRAPVPPTRPSIPNKRTSNVYVTV